MMIIQCTILTQINQILWQCSIYLIQYSILEYNNFFLQYFLLIALIINNYFEIFVLIFA